MEIDKPTIIAIILLAVILLSFFLVVPKYKQFKDFQMQVGIKTAEYENKYAYYSEIARLTRELENRKDILDKIDIALPSDPTYSSIVYFLQKKAGENGIFLKSVNLSKGLLAEQEGVKEIGFSLNMMGDYTSLKNFIDSLEGSSRIFELNSISFSSAINPQQETKSSETGGAEAYSFQVQIKTNSY